MNNTTSFQLLVRAGLLLVFIALLSTCSEKEAEPQLSGTVKAFYDQFFKIAEENSINRRKIDWAEYKSKVLARVGNAATVSETHETIKLALSLLQDNHSFMLAPGNAYISGAGIGCGALVNSPEPVLADIGYVLLNGFSGGGQAAVDLATAIQAAIRKQDTDALKGWIVDLRNNTGGNMWPMAAGIGPLIGEGVCGYFIGIDNQPVSAWSYVAGKSIDGKSVNVQVDQPYQLKKPNPKVAVLIGPATASSGEATTLAFVGRPQTRLFGSLSCGLSTSNKPYTLSGGYQIYLTVASMGDRTGKAYGKAIVPDVITTSETTIGEAAKWIMQ